MGAIANEGQDQNTNTSSAIALQLVQALNNLNQTLEAFDAASTTGFADLNTTLEAIDATLVIANTDSTAINTTLGSINTTLAAVNTTLGNIKTTLDTANTNSAAINTTLAAINTTLSTVFPVHFFVGSATYNPPNITSGSQATTTVTVTGAVLGNDALPSFSLDLQGLNLTAYVSSANTVTCVFSNLTGGAIDLASGILSARVLS